MFVKTANPEISAPAPTFNGDGSMEVPRQANGHFYLPGTIDTIPVTFMVDTGTSVTSISSDLARQAGIRNCKEVQFQTANGTANGCIALVPRMTLGSFQMENITVAVMREPGNQPARRQRTAGFSSETERQQHADRTASTKDDT